jgi:glycosyltransferase involved in cell wall biosynthesis
MNRINRILQINSVVNFGSTGRIVEEIGQLVIQKGWNSYIAYGRYDRTSNSEIIKIGTEWDTNIHGLQSRLFDRHGLGSLNATIKLVEIIKGIQPDIIHLHNLHGYYLNIKFLFSYLALSDIPVIWTFHDCWPITGHCVYFDFVKCERWKTECYSCPQKKSYPKSIFLDSSKANFLLKKELFRSVKRMVIAPVSQWLANIVRESFLKDYPIMVIRNGIDLIAFSPQLDNDIIRKKYLIGNRFLILGVAAIWDERKGLKDFIMFSEKLPNDYVILLVGLNEKQIKGLPLNIIGITRTEKILELTELYSAADLYINPTWEDNFPTTNLEALACGTPIATYRTGGSIEAISPETGFIVEKGDIFGLLNIATKVKEKGKNSYSNACRERAVKYYSNKERFEEYIELYNNMIEK